MENQVGTLKRNRQRALGYVRGTERGEERLVQSLASAPLVEHTRFDTQLPQDCSQITTAVARNDSELPIGWNPPTLVGARGPAHKLAAQLA